MNTVRRWLLIGLAVSALAGVAMAASWHDDVALPDLDGRMRRLSEYIGRGQWVVLNIWGPRCPPCVLEMPALQRFHDQQAAAGRAIVLGLALDFPSFGMARRDQVAQFLDDYLVSFPVLLTDGATAARIAGGRLEGTPTTLVFRPDGRLAARHTGMVTKDWLDAVLTAPPAQP